MRITACAPAVIALFVAVTGASAQTAPHVQTQTAPHAPMAHRTVGVVFTAEHAAMLRQDAASRHFAPVQDSGIHAQVGAILPNSVELHPLPDALVAHLPAAGQYRYTIVHGRPVVVDPGSHRIVHVDE